MIHWCIGIRWGAFCSPAGFRFRLDNILRALGVVMGVSSAPGYSSLFMAMLLGSWRAHGRPRAKASYATLGWPSCWRPHLRGNAGGLVAHYIEGHAAT